MTTISPQDIITYYDKCEVAYRDVWDLDYSLAMHYGYWEKSTKNLRQALANLNKKLAETTQITQRDIVLDAGCGLGGSAIFLAQNYQCRVVGITLSAQQAQKATQKLAPLNLYSLVQYEVQDYLRTSFEAESFNVIWAIESVCHASDKALFLQEAHRLLKKGGRIIIADGFRLDKNYTEAENSLLAQWTSRWAIPHLAQPQALTQAAQKLGLTKIRFYDITKHIFPSAKRLHFWAKLALTYGKISHFLGKKYGNEHTIQNTIGAKMQYIALKNHLWQYGIWVAQKP